MLRAGDRQYDLVLQRGDRSVAAAVKTHDLLTSPAAVAP
jgi:hypothetical protein